VVEGAVLHHQHDDRVEGQVARGGDGDPVAGGRLAEDRVGTEDARHPHRHAAGQRRALEELATAHEAVGVTGLDPLCRCGVVRIVGIEPLAAFRSTHRPDAEAGRERRCKRRVSFLEQLSGSLRPKVSKLPF
jgi:hypothetical protein